MANLKYRFNPEDFYPNKFLEKRQKGQKRKKKTGSSSEQGNQPIQVDDQEGSNLSDRGAAQGPVPPSYTGSTSGVVQVTVPALASAQTGYQALFEELVKLLLSEDIDHIKNPGIPHCYNMAASTAFSNYQYTVFMKERLLELEGQLQSADSARTTLKEQLRLVKGELRKGKAEWADTEAYLRGQLAANGEEIKRLKAELAELEATREHDINYLWFETVIEIEGRMGQQVLDKEHENWPNEERVARWKRLQASREAAGDKEDGSE